MSFLTETIGYANSANFTFDSNLITFNGTNAQLKSIRPANSTFYNGFHAGFNGEYGNGSLVATPVNSPVVSGNAIDFSGGAQRYVDYSAVANADFQQIGTIRFQWTPLYNGSPAQFQYLFGVCKAPGDSSNFIDVYHDTGGTLIFRCFDQNNANIFAQNMGTYSAVSGSTVEIELDINITAGASRMFINGIQFGPTIAATGTRSSSISVLRLGNFPSTAQAVTSNFKVTDFIVFNTVQHTANFPGEIPRLPETFYSTQTPTVTYNIVQPMSALVDFLETSTLPANSGLQYTLLINGVQKYWNGASWVTSNGTFAQSNTAATIQANATALNLISGANFQPVAFLSSTLGNSTPILTTLTVDYLFFQPAPSSPSQCIVFVFLEDIVGITNLTNAKFICSIAQSFVINTWVVGISEVIITFSSSGYAQASLVSSNTVGVKYSFSITYTDQAGIGRQIFFNDAVVPAQPFIGLTALTTIQAGS